LIVRSMTVRNYRCIGQAVLECDRLVALVGRNGAGKSALLHALEFFFHPAAQLQAEDFLARDVENSVEVTVSFTDLSGDEQLEFASYVQDGTLTVTKRTSWDGSRSISRYYASSMQLPAFAKIRALPLKSERRAAWNDLVDTGVLPDQKHAASADQAEEFMAAYESEHPDQLEACEMEGQFFGAQNVGGGKLDTFTKFVLISGVTEVDEQVSGKRGAFQQILEAIVMRKLTTRADVQQFKKDYAERAKAVFSPENLGELPELQEALSRSLHEYAPGSEVHLAWKELAVPEIPAPPVAATLVEDTFEGDVGRKGHGLQRALVMTLLQYLARLEDVSSETGETAGEPADGGALTGSGASPTLILAIEEPELYLHPSRGRHLAQVLFQLAEQVGGRTQVLYTTHSPHFVDLERFDQVRVVQKRRSGEAVVPTSSVSQYSLAAAATRMAAITGRDAADFTRESFRVRAIPVMNTLVNEGFFAEACVVVEGPTELGILWRLQEILDLGWSGRGVAIVMARGKNSVDRPVVIFRGLQILTYFLYDSDAHLTGKEREQTADTNRRLLRLAAQPDEEAFVHTQVHAEWATFEDNIEGVLREELGAPLFDELRASIAEEYGLDKPSRVTKNSEGAARLIALAYERGARSDTLEKIVRAVSDLLPTDTLEKHDQAEGT
jgi:putative ATP-dependent endonuclease of OLD family